uniref:hypothetical protein n=1 Tax=Micromonospora sp. NBC_00855 TaxID=2975978 RepID=UPI0022564F35|nr:hypothetical protein OHB51_35295 [Micromonospora sp. NBC_00855]
MTGEAGHNFTDGPYDVLADDVTSALGAAFGTVVDAEPLYSPAVRQLLEVAERIARDSGATTVDVAHVETALSRRRARGGETTR